MKEGIIKRWMIGKNYGFIGVDGMEKEVFVHLSDVKSKEALHEGQKVKFDIENTPKGPRAVNVEVVE